MYMFMQISVEIRNVVQAQKMIGKKSHFLKSHCSYGLSLKYLMKSQRAGASDRGPPLRPRRKSELQLRELGPHLCQGWALASRPEGT